MASAITNDPYLIDPSHLNEDELQYELQLREIKIDSPARLTRLKARLEEEVNGVYEFPTDNDRIQGHSVGQEVKDCDRKLSEIEFAVSEATRQADEEMIERAQSRLVHITGRIIRLQSYAPEHAAVARLIKRSKIAGQNIRQTRDSIGVGEEGFIGFDEDDLVQGPPRRPTTTYPQGLGAIPKVRVGDASRTFPPKSSAQLRPTLTLSSEPSKGRTGKSPRAPATDIDSPRFTQAASNNALTKPHFSASLLGSMADLLQPEINPLQQNLAPSVRQLFDDPAIIRTQPKVYEPTLRQPPPRQIGSVVSINRPSVAHGGSSSAMEYPVSGNRERGVAPSKSSMPIGRQDRFACAGGHRIHQWSLRFDGGSNGLDAEDFVFRIERQAQLYGVANETLAIGIGELFEGRAAKWYWTFQRQHARATWDQIKEEFVRRHASHRNTDFEIRARIEARKQKPAKRFYQFCQDIEALAVRLTRQMEEDELVEVLRRNMAMNLRKALWRDRID